MGDLKADLIAHICRRLEQQEPAARAAFAGSAAEVGVRYCAFDDVLPEELARRIHAAFPAPERMRLMSSFREVKYTSKSFDEYDPILAAITFAMQDPAVIRIVERITGIAQQVPDPTLYAGGLSMMCRGQFLGPHIDNSHEASRTLYRTLNLLYYVTPGWRLENGGNLELWDQGVRKNVTIFSRFNRLVLMETTPRSWHSVSTIVADGFRCCVSNYYFSPLSPTGSEYFNVTSFSARPEQKVRRLISWADNRLRQAVRKVIPGGVGRKDVYQGSRK
jgi:Rps23 Pro-64 3,4-dihydroxylase Tpa1-like proline 4-hydroxylase